MTGVWRLRAQAARPCTPPLLGLLSVRDSLHPRPGAWRLLFFSGLLLGCPCSLPAFPTSGVCFLPTPLLSPPPPPRRGPPPPRSPRPCSPPFPLPCPPPSPAPLMFSGPECPPPWLIWPQWPFPPPRLTGVPPCSCSTWLFHWGTWLSPPVHGVSSVRPQCLGCDSHPWGVSEWDS